MHSVTPSYVENVVAEGVPARSPGGLEVDFSAGKVWGIRDIPGPVVDPRGHFGILEVCEKRAKTAATKVLQKRGPMFAKK